MDAALCDHFRTSQPNDSNKRSPTDTKYLSDSYLGLGQSGSVRSH